MPGGVGVENRAENLFLILSELFRELDDSEFLAAYEDGIAEVLRLALNDIRDMKQCWQALADEDKLAEVAANAKWINDGDHDYIAAERVPTLLEALKQRRRIYLGGYVYFLSGNGKWVYRYPRRKPQPAPRARGGERG